MLLSNTLILASRTAANVILTLLLVRWLLIGLGQEAFGTFMAILSLSAIGRPLAGSLGYAAFRNVALELGRLSGPTHAASAEAEYAGPQRAFEEAMVISVAAAAAAFVAVLFSSELLLRFVNYQAISTADARSLLIALSFANIVGMVASGPYRAVLNAREEFATLAVWEVGQTAILAFFALLASVLSLGAAPLGIAYSFSLTLWNAIGAAFVRARTPWARVRRLPRWASVASSHQVSLWHLVSELSAWARINMGVILGGRYLGAAAASAFAIGGRVDEGIDRTSRPIVDAIRPRIVRSVGAGDQAAVADGVSQMSRVGGLAAISVAMPLLTHGSLLLEAWLTDVPSGAVQIVALMALTRVLQTASLPYLHVAAATNRLQPPTVAMLVATCMGVGLGWTALANHVGDPLAYPLILLGTVGIVSLAVIPLLVGERAGLPSRTFYFGSLVPSSTVLLAAVASVVLSRQVLGRSDSPAWSDLALGLIVLWSLGWCFLLSSRERRLILRLFGHRP